MGLTYAADASDVSSMSTNRSPQAESAAATVPLCPECPAHLGLCTSCGRTVLPQLKQPSWHLDAHRGEHFVAEKLSPAGEKVRRRKARKAASRLARALRGEHTRVTKARAA